MPTNGSIPRHFPNWIEAFVEQTSNLHSPQIFRLWTALSVLAATLEQKVWVVTNKPLYPNLYTFLVGHPGVGKSRVIAEGRELYKSLPEPYLAPISLTFASLTDALARSKRRTLRQPDGEYDYHTSYICVDEMGTFIHKFEDQMIAGLSAFYDAADYQQERRVGGLKVNVKNVQVNLIIGATPQNLMKFLPEYAWGQGFTSRFIMVFSDERIVPDDFAEFTKPKIEELIHDLKIINTLTGQFTVTDKYRDAVRGWQALGEPPVPDHPKLTHYITRRRVHLYRLSMLSSINKSNGLVLTEEDFLQALEWLVQAEKYMPDVFKAGTINSDGSAMEEIQHFVRVNDLGTGVSEHRIVHFAQQRIPSSSILRVVEIMLSSGQIIIKRVDKRTGVRYFSAALIVQPTAPDAILNQ